MLTRAPTQHPRGGLRTPELLIEAAADHPDDCTRLVPDRKLLATAQDGNPDAVAAALADEERRERDLDREHWRPLRKELERLREERRPPEHR